MKISLTAFNDSRLRRYTSQRGTTSKWSSHLKWTVGALTVAAVQADDGLRGRPAQRGDGDFDPIRGSDNSGGGAFSPSSSALPKILEPSKRKTASGPILTADEKLDVLVDHFYRKNDADGDDLMCLVLDASLPIGSDGGKYETTVVDSGRIVDECPKGYLCAADHMDSVAKRYVTVNGGVLGKCADKTAMSTPKQKIDTTHHESFDDVATLKEPFERSDDWEAMDQEQRSLHLLFNCLLDPPPGSRPGRNGPCPSGQTCTMVPDSRIHPSRRARKPNARRGTCVDITAPPTSSPSGSPTSSPATSASPSGAPSFSPSTSMFPSEPPSGSPSDVPSELPTSPPTTSASPSDTPSSSPSISQSPSESPSTAQVATSSPTVQVCATNGMANILAFCADPANNCCNNGDSATCNTNGGAAYTNITICKNSCNGSGPNVCGSLYDNLYIGENSCVGSFGSQNDNTCNGLRSGSLVESCQGPRSCSKTGLQQAFKSCIGALACTLTDFSSVISFTCLGPVACGSTGRSQVINAGNSSCIGQSSCFQPPPSGERFLFVGANSCNGISSCCAPRDYGDLLHIGDSSCNGESACDNVREGTTIFDLSCRGKNACARAEEVDIGPNACNGPPSGATGVCQGATMDYTDGQRNNV